MIRFRVHTQTDRSYGNVISLSDREAILFIMRRVLYLSDPMSSMENDIGEESERHGDINANNFQQYDETDKKYDTCPICINAYSGTDTVCILNCKHVYHPNCIKEWSKYKMTCPMCKREILR